MLRQKAHTVRPGLIVNVMLGVFTLFSVSSFPFLVLGSHQNKDFTPHCSSAEHKHDYQRHTGTKDQLICMLVLRYLSPQ